MNGGGRIDVRTGEVWALAAVEYAEGGGVLDSDEVDDQRWLEVVCEGSRAAYRDWRRSSTAWMTFGLRIGWGGRFRAGERFVGQGRAGRLA